LTERKNRRRINFFAPYPMNAAENNGRSNEEAFIKCYMDLTGGTESQARAVFMHVCCKDEEKMGGEDGLKTLQTSRSIRRAVPEADSSALAKLAQTMRMIPRPLAQA